MSGFGIPRGYGSRTHEMPVTSSQLGDHDQLWHRRKRGESRRRDEEAVAGRPLPEAIDPLSEARFAALMRALREQPAVPALRPEYFGTPEHRARAEDWRRTLTGGIPSAGEPPSHVLLRQRTRDGKLPTGPLSVDDVPEYGTDPEWRHTLETEVLELTTSNFAERPLLVGGSGKEQIVLRYGDIVAFAGDFFGTPKELEQAFRGKISGRIRALAAAKGGWFWSGLLSMISAIRKIPLALRNEPHFSPHTWVAYTRHHLDALKLALDRDLEAALRINAFGDHFLTDAFASGHIRTPRLILGRDKLPWRMAKALSMHKEDNEHGLWVANRAGYVWHAYGDDRLHLNPVHQVMTTVAITRSVRRVNRAFRLEGDDANRLRNKIESAQATLQDERDPTTAHDPAFLDILGDCGFGMPNIVEWLPIDVAATAVPGGGVITNYPPLVDDDGRDRKGTPAFDEYFCIRH